MECTLIFDYKGLIELARRSGEISIFRAELVCENDDFSYNKSEVTRHIIDFKKPRGSVYAVYSYVRFTNNTEDYEVMTKEEVKAIEGRSKAKSSGPWVTDWNEMAKKTVIRRHAKRLPLSAEFRDAEDRDGDRLANLVEPDRAVLPAGVSHTDALADRLADSATAALPDATVFCPCPTSDAVPCPECGSLQTTEAAAEAPFERFCTDCGSRFNNDGSIPADSTAADPKRVTQTDVPVAAKEEDKKQAEPADNPPTREVTAFCPSCSAEKLFVVFKDGSAQCQDCSKTYGQLPTTPESA